MKYLSLLFTTGLLAVLLVAASSLESDTGQRIGIWSRLGQNLPSTVSYDSTFTQTVDDVVVTVSLGQMFVSYSGRYFYRHEDTRILVAGYEYADGSREWDRELYGEADIDTVWIREIGKDWKVVTYSIDRRDLRSFERGIRVYPSGLQVKRVTFDGKSAFELNLVEDYYTYRWTVSKDTYRVLYSYRYHYDSESRTLRKWEYLFRSPEEPVRLPPDIPNLGHPTGW